ncbi:hypothetical protein MSAN_00314000 [Mycena sanguinolenta]|uniref:Uncharacterized protein n=1 Tax=Mycena sanguinolenta TaxID=230812 RepID=A0A8H7DJ84_9AGAR|nr:hypothetical protein MSAN_00314000 [Mycena sanguinolenta]
MRLGDVRVWVSVDDAELSEFAVEYSGDEKEASCWIPSECGKNFSINWGAYQCVGTCSRCFAMGEWQFLRTQIYEPRPHASTCLGWVSHQCRDVGHHPKTTVICAARVDR